MAKALGYTVFGGLGLLVGCTIMAACSVTAPLAVAIGLVASAMLPAFVASYLLAV